MKNEGQAIISLMDVLFNQDETLKTVIVHADRIHDDTEAIQLICDGKARGILPDGRPINEQGGTFMIKDKLTLVDLP